MADLFLNFKDFHHENTDDKSTTLRHKKLGHKITLAHNVLSDKNKAALMAMAKSAKKSQTPDQAGETESQDHGYGKVIKMADGGETKQPYVPPAEMRDPSPTPPPVEKSKNDRLRDLGHKASGGGQNHPTLDPHSWWAQGGQVCMDEGGKIPMPSGSNAEAQVNQQNKLKGIGKSASGGGVNHPTLDPRTWMADGGDVPDYLAKDAPVEDSGAPISEDPNSPQPGVAENIGNAIGQHVAKKFINPARAAYNLTSKGQPGDIVGNAADVIGNAGKGVMTGISKGTGVDLSGKDEEQQSSAPAIPPPAEQPASMPMAANQAPPIATAPNPLAQGAADSENMMVQGYQKQMAGIQQESAAKQGLGQATSEALARDAQARVQAQSVFQQHYNELDQERKALQADIQNGHIDPNKFWTGGPNGEGGHSKIAAGIGMILAGFNPTNSPNAAINFLKYQMDQNLEAQKQNLGSKQNLLSANLRQFGNLKDATEMTRIMQGDILSNELQTAAAKASTPMAKAAALNAQGQLQAQMAPVFQSFALRRAMMSAANSGNSGATDQLMAYARMSNPEMAKEMEQRYVPGVGMGKMPVPESVRSQIVSAKTSNDLFNDSLQMAHQPIPNPATHPMEYRKYVSTAETLRNQLIGTIKQQQHDGVYKPSEAEFLIKQIGDSPSSVFRSISSIPKLQELQKIKQQEYSNMLNTYGIPNQQLTQAPAQQQQEIKIGKDGHKYMRQGNFMVPVK